MKYLYIAISALALSSCITEKKRQEICNTCIRKDSVTYKEVVKLKDTTIYITEPGPVQWMQNPCQELCDSLGNLKPFDIKKKKNGIISEIKTIGNSIVFECKADSLKAVIKGLKETIKTRSETINSVKWLPCDKEHRTAFDGFCRWFFWIACACVGVFSTIKLIKMKTKL